ncbi:Glycosyltransferase [Brachybacterium faecium]|uniref:D-inositol 3-phosphate glycosyltransferase n=1 Tax=Brachybacterium faecium (strain ATCC 43885 / DSM 4810 / JCM 11609 / LMG 19847 / NBRC 14762 / NCIMB 9860 / 6-10) TaxID=446465 RepID=C7MH11_BRAFD|nr:glycosyltransferase family 1 protein [Brachybacterium faecium]ACU86459.1 glycosyltransferase [Brachybacterium faecium DSM 4810]SLN03159.1 Glycosyltransferase [Brachybacterium faecium]
MKIAIVTETFLPSVDGVVTRLRHAVERFTELGHEVMVIAPELGVTEHAGARVVGIRPVTLPFYKHRRFTLPTPTVDGIIRGFHPDVVHAAQPILLASSGAFAAKRQRIPLVASYHTHIPRYLDLYRAWSWGKPAVWWQIKRNHALADVNIATSETMRAELAEKGLPNLHVVRRGVDTQTFHPRFASAAMRERLTQGHPEKKLLVFVGRLAAEKEIHTLRPMMERRDDVALAIVGDGPYRRELEQHFAGTATLFPGFMEGEELASAFASADAFVFPSVTETLGLVILEGMASGLPVVAARSGPTMEQVTDGVDGLLFDSGDEASLDAALTRLGDDALRGRIREAARAEAERFSWENASDDLLRYYEMAIEQHA